MPITHDPISRPFLALTPADGYEPDEEEHAGPRERCYLDDEAEADDALEQMVQDAAAYWRRRERESLAWLALLQGDEIDADSDHDDAFADLDEDWDEGDA